MDRSQASRATVTKSTQTSIVSHKPAGSSGRILGLAPLPDFEAGQVVGIRLNEADAPRWYSLASAPRAGIAEVLYTRVADGFLTPRLWEAAPGTPLWIDGPRGTFLDKAPGETRWWISNGTGIAPFASIVAEALHGSGDSARVMREALPHRVLVHGCRTPDDAYYRHLFEEAARNHGLTYILCISSGEKLPPGDVSRGEIVAGRMTVWLKENWLARSAPQTVMLCGSSGMISEVRELLLEWRFPYESIVTEVYF